MPLKDMDSLVADTLADDLPLVPIMPAPDLAPGQSRENPEEKAGSRQGHVWAEDCYWVYDHLGERLAKSEVGSPGRWALYQMAQKDPNKFVWQILPKAMALVEKARDRAGDEDTVVLEERKSIAELQSILKAAVLEAAAGVV